MNALPPRCGARSRAAVGAGPVLLADFALGVSGLPGHGAGIGTGIGTGLARRLKAALLWDPERLRWGARPSFGSDRFHSERAALRWHGCTGRWWGHPARRCSRNGAMWHGGRVMGWVGMGDRRGLRPEWLCVLLLGSDPRLSSLQAYNIHVNGVLHCRVRYSQLLGLHEQVGRRAARSVLCQALPAV